MATTHREREDKFAVDPAFTMPDLRALAPADGGVAEATLTLRSTYFDTADQALLRHGITLRRREGDADEGWQMKVPDGDARTEIRLPLTGAGDDIPGELAELAAGIALGRPLAVVAVVRTSRRVQRLTGADGGVLLEAADDTVTASAPGDDAVTLTSWREVELELGSGTEALLAKAGRRVRKAGATPSADASKLGRALGATTRAPATATTASEALTAYIAEQFHTLAVGDVELRRGLDPIHPTRVATRRLRSTLRVYGELFAPEAARQLDVELAWYAGLLGEVRDREVQRERFAAAVAELPTELVLGPVAAQIEERLLSEQLVARQVLLAEMSETRYLSLLETVAAWATAPPLSRASQVDAQRLVPMARTAGRKATRRLAAALRSTSGDDAALHSARKAAKRARYAMEACEPIIGRKKAKAHINQYKAVQEALGDHQDSLVAAEVLRRLGAQAGTTPGQNGFTYGLLYAREQRIAQESRARAAELI